MQRKGTMGDSSLPGQQQKSDLLIFCVPLILSLQRPTAFLALSIVMQIIPAHSTMSGASSLVKLSDGQGRIHWQTR